MLEGSQRLRCHECDQLYFVYILLEIIKGKEYWDIELFEYMLDMCNQTIIIRREIGLTQTDPQFAPFSDMSKGHKIFSHGRISAL